MTEGKIADLLHRVGVFAFALKSKCDIAPPEFRFAFSEFVPHCCDVPVVPGQLFPGGRMQILQMAESARLFQADRLGDGDEILLAAAEEFIKTVAGDRVAEIDVVVQPAAAAVGPQRAAVGDKLPEKTCGLLRNYLHLRHEQHLVALQCVKRELGDKVHRDVRPVQRLVTTVDRIVVFVAEPGNVRFVPRLLEFEAQLRHRQENRHLRCRMFHFGQYFAVAFDIKGKPFCRFRPLRRRTILSPPQTEFSNLHHARTPRLPLPEEHSAQSAAERVIECAGNILRRRCVTVWMIMRRPGLQFADPGIVSLRPAPYFVNAAEVGGSEVFLYVMSEKVVRRMDRDADGVENSGRFPFIQPGVQSVVEDLVRIGMGFVDRVNGFNQIPEPFHLLCCIIL